MTDHGVQSTRRTRLLFASKQPQRWNDIFVRKFNNHSLIGTFYFSDHVGRLGYAGAINELNTRLTRDQIDIVLLDLEFYSAIGIDLLGRLRSETMRVLLCFDDAMLHDFNILNALACHHVACAEPTAVFRYREAGLSASHFLLENSYHDFQSFAKLPKDIDVLFVGDLTKGDRRSFTDRLTAAGIPLTIHDPSLHGFLSYENLAHLISRSRILLNLSKSNDVGTRPESHFPINRHLQFKGRIIEAGLGRAVCVSEYSPSVELLFDQETVPVFHSTEEAVATLKHLLANPTRLDQLAEKFQMLILSKYEETIQVNDLMQILPQLPIEGDLLPSWVPIQYVCATAIDRFATGRSGPLGFTRDLVDFCAAGHPYRKSQKLGALALAIAQLARKATQKLRRHSNG